MEEVILWPKRHGDAGPAGWGRGRGVGRAMVIADGPQCGRKNKWLRRCRQSSLLGRGNLEDDEEWLRMDGRRRTDHDSGVEE
jgi:hypothetical protein